MSSSIKGNIITLTRGDTFRAKVSMQYEDDGEEYIPEAGDSVRFALKHRTLKSDKSDYEDVEPLIYRDIPIDTMILTLVPNDTKSLGFGKYEYDIELVYADGTTDTFITASPFILDKEVH